MSHSRANDDQSRSLTDRSAPLRTATQDATGSDVCGPVRGDARAGVTQIVTHARPKRDARAWEWMIWLGDKEAA